MSRSGYSDDYDNWDLIRWRGAVASAMRGSRGQAALKELLAALDALPEKKLIRNLLTDADGNVCALGALGKARKLPIQDLDPEDRATVANVFRIAEAMAAEILFMNDEGYYWNATETPEHRFQRMRAWIESLIQPLPSGKLEGK